MCCTRPWEHSVTRTRLRCTRSWERFIEQLSWERFIEQLSREHFIEQLSREHFIEQLSWERFIEQLSWECCEGVLQVRPAIMGELGVIVCEANAKSTRGW